MIAKKTNIYKICNKFRMPWTRSYPLILCSAICRIVFQFVYLIELQHVLLIKCPSHCVNNDKNCYPLTTHWLRYHSPLFCRVYPDSSQTFTELNRSKGQSSGCYWNGHSVSVSTVINNDVTHVLIDRKIVSSFVMHYVQSAAHMILLLGPSNLQA